MSPYRIWKSGCVWYVWRQTCQTDGVLLMLLCVQVFRHKTHTHTQRFNVQCSDVCWSNSKSRLHCSSFQKRPFPQAMTSRASRHVTSHLRFKQSSSKAQALISINLNLSALSGRLCCPMTIILLFFPPSHRR